MNKLLPIVLAFFAALAVTPSYASETDENAATIASKHWLELVDKGEYGKSWESCALLFKTSVRKKDLESKLKATRGMFGQLINRKLKSKQFVTALPGVPDGKYVVIQYNTSFSEKKQAVETITPMLDKYGLWKVCGYVIK